MLLSDVQKLKLSLHPREIEWISLVECISTRGDVLSPFIVFKGKVLKRSWFDIVGIPHADINVSGNGWTTNGIGL